MATEAHNPHDNRGPMVLAAASVLVFLSTVFGLARFYARTWIRKQVYLDDLFVAISVVLLLYSLVCVSIAVSNGQGRHFETLTVQQQERVIFWYMLAVPAIVPALGIPKLAVATILVRILVPGPRARAIAWGLAITSTLAYIAIVFIIFFQCLPVQAQWNFSIKDKKCMDVSVTIWCSIFASAFSAFVDFYFAVWPAVIFYSMQMSRFKTVGLSFVMGIGAIAAGLAVYKCTNFGSLADPDFSWANNGTVITTHAEASAIVIAASIPMLAPIYRSIRMSYKKVRRHVFGTPMKQPRPEARPENMAREFPTHKRMRPRDDAELGRSSLATSQADIWDPRYLYSHARESRSGTQSARAYSTRLNTRPSTRDHGPRNTHTQTITERQAEPDMETEGRRDAGTQTAGF